MSRLAILAPLVLGPANAPDVFIKLSHLIMRMAEHQGWLLQDT